MRLPGLGCMRLSTEHDRDDARAVGVVRAALDAGIELFDTADAYCWDEREAGHNERLIARALATWPGDRSRIRIATKGGLTRPDGRWVPDARAKHLRSACERSLLALGVEQIALYQLHAPDPRTPLATSVRALDRLKRDGLIAAVGLCNVTVGQIEEARRITEIVSVQVELSPWHDHHVLSGVVDYCLANELVLLAYRPLGGPQRRRKVATDPTLAAIAARHDASPSEITLAWLMSLSERIVPIPGATRDETVESIARAGRIALTDADRDDLDQRFTALAASRQSSTARHTTSSPRVEGDVVIVMGMPAAGKSTLAQSFVADGYHRLNRDEHGGTLAGLLPALDCVIDGGSTRIVLDNTYPTRKARAQVIQAARARGLSVRCVWLSTSLEDAQTNAAWRIVTRYGGLPSDDQLAQVKRSDVAAFLPGAQFKYRRELEPPEMTEGFSRVDVVPFIRRFDADFTNRAVIVSCDDPADLAALAPSLRTFRDSGHRLLAVAWQPGITEGTQTEISIKARFADQCQRLGFEIDVECCPHSAGPPKCWCRKPLPSLGVVFVIRYRLNPALCTFVGSGPHDVGFARRLGFKFLDRDAGESAETSDS